MNEVLSTIAKLYSFRNFTNHPIEIEKVEASP
jgi:hypothetical protein